MEQPPDVWYYDNELCAFTMVPSILIGRSNSRSRNSLYMIQMFPHPEGNTRYIGGGPIGSYSVLPTFYGYNASRCKPVPILLAERLTQCAIEYDYKMYLKYDALEGCGVNCSVNPGEISAFLYDLVQIEVNKHYQKEMQPRKKEKQISYGC